MRQSTRSPSVETIDDGNLPAISQAHPPRLSIAGEAELDSDDMTNVCAQIPFAPSSPPCRASIVDGHARSIWQIVRLGAPTRAQPSHDNLSRDTKRPQAASPRGFGR